LATAVCIGEQSLQFLQQQLLFDAVFNLQQDEILEDCVQAWPSKM
jgi:hypothetical protein